MRKGTIMSKYKNLGLLGQGVFSSVYLAENDQGQKFALKYYTNKESDAVRQKYTVEASTLIQLDNPNILKVHDFGEDELGMYIAMDYMEFGNLRDRISRKGALDLERTLVVAISIIRALETFHNAGKIHKDIRPENLFNSTDGYLKVADFGTLINHVSLSSLPVETVYYTAPEVLENAPDIDCRADIYSLGATLFHIFTGQAVYHSENTIDVVNMHLTDQPVALSNYVADCPESFVAIIQKMMSFNKQDRYQDIYELEKDLQVVMTGMTSVEDLPSYQSPGATLVAPIVLADYREEEIEVVASVDTEVKLETLTGKDEGVLTAESGKPVRKHLDMSNIKLHWHMKLLVACAWLIGPVILGVYVYESYFKEKAPAPIVEVEKPKQKLMISANDFALADESPKKKALPTKKALRKPAAKKQNTLSFAKYSEKVLPVELVEIDKRNFFCSFKIKQKAGWLSEVLTLGQRKSSVRLIAIEDSSAVVDVDGSSYRLKIGQKYRLSYNLALALGGEDFVIFDHESSVDKGYKMVSLDEKVVKIQTPKNKLVSLNVDLDLSSNAIPVTGAVRSELLKRSKGVVTSFVKLDHEYFPILVNSVSKTSINYSMFVNGAVINYGNAAVSTTLAKRYQINFIGSDWVLLKDRKTAKNIRLKVKQQIILKNAAVVSYRNKDHKVSAGENFFGYKVEFKNGQLSFWISYSKSSWISYSIYLSSGTSLVCR